MPLIWWYALWAVVGFVVAYAFAPRTESPQQKPASITDFNFPTADESRAIPVVFGTVRVADPNVVWYGDLRTRAIRKKGGGKK